MKPAFSDIVGNKRLCARFAEDVLRENLSHAYILDGAQGWYALKVATDVSALLEVALGGSVSSASLLGRGPGCFVILR